MKDGQVFMELSIQVVANLKWLHENYFKSCGSLDDVLREVISLVTDTLEAAAKNPKGIAVVRFSA